VNLQSSQSSSFCGLPVISIMKPVSSASSLNFARFNKWMSPVGSFNL